MANFLSSRDKLCPLCIINGSILIKGHFPASSSFLLCPWFSRPPVTLCGLVLQKAHPLLTLCFKEGSPKIISISSSRDQFVSRILLGAQYGLFSQEWTWASGSDKLVRVSKRAIWDCVRVRVRVRDRVCSQDSVLGSTRSTEDFRELD